MEKEPELIDYIEIENGLTPDEFFHATDLSRFVGEEISSNTHQNWVYKFVFTRKMMDEGYWTVEDVSNNNYDGEFKLIFKFNRKMSDSERRNYLEESKFREKSEKAEYERLKKKFEGS